LTTSGARALLSGLVDYAGLFPPAGLDMARAAATYAEKRSSSSEFMLGRFVVPAARLGELEMAAERLWPARAGVDGPIPSEGRPWALSVLVGPAMEAHAAAILDFGARRTSQAKVEAVELTAATAAEAEAALAVLPAGLLTYVELPTSGDLDPLLAVLRQRRARAKVRTGGVTTDAIPDPTALAGFIAACVRNGLAFKATAGLHHPVRGEHPLTYEPDAPRATMHGFLNVFTAAALAREAASTAELETVLREEDPAAFRLDDRGLSWRDRTLDLGSLTSMRRDLAHSFGSCSFDEPVSDLRGLGIIP